MKHSRLHWFCQPKEEHDAVFSVDLSHVIQHDMPVFPGTPAPSLESGASIASDGYREKRLHFSSHTGTHMDAPAHILPHGKTLDQFSIEKFAGAACVLNVRELAGQEIGLTNLHQYKNQIAAAEFVLLRSGWSSRWGSTAYFADFPTLTPEAAEWLVTCGLKGIGVDMISVDPMASKDLPIHNILLKAELVIIENLTNLDRLPATGSFLACYPLRILEADGSPVRAVATFDS